MYPILNEKIYRLADKLHSSMLNSYRLLKSAQSGVNTGPNYKDLLGIPLQNKELSSVVSLILTLSAKPLILTYLSEQFEETVSEADITNYLADYAGLAATVESNTALFLPSTNATNKGTQYITPVSEGIKSAINAKITSVLTNVTE